MGDRVSRVGAHPAPLDPTRARRAPQAAGGPATPAAPAAPGLAGDALGTRPGVGAADPMAALLASDAAVGGPSEEDYDAIFGAIEGGAIPVEPTAPVAGYLTEARPDAGLFRNLDIAGRTIEVDYEDSTTAVRGAEVEATIMANEQAAVAAAGRLSVDQNRMLRELGQIVAPPGGRGDTAALAGLQQLLIEGRLAGGPANGQGEDLLTALHRVGTGELAPDVDRTALMAQLVREIAQPSAINQGTYGTCGPSSLQMYLAHVDPAELVRVVGGLAGPAGAVTLRNGETLRRDGAADSERLGDGRSIPNRLFTAAISEHGNGTEAEYDPARGTHSDGAAALSTAELNRTLTALTGDRFVDVGRSDAAMPVSAEVRAQVERAARAGEPIPVALEWTGAGTEHAMHEVLLLGFEGDRVRIQNPWGTEETFPADAFFARLHVAALPQ